MLNVELSPKELARYARHLAIPEFGIEGQKRLKVGKVLVIGSGGLGSPLLLYLTAAGVGNIGIVDFDVVDETNLQRQVLFTVDDVGKSKAETAAEKLKKLNPNVHFKVYNTPFTSDNALDIIKDYDVVADGTDNFPTRYLVNDACVLSNKVNVYASIFRFEGQVSVFNFPLADGTRCANYRDMFPEPPPPGLVPNCAEGGVLGVLPGIIGSMQASEVIKVLTGVGEPLAGRLFTLDAATFETRTLKVRKNPNTTITTLIDYQQFCGILPHNNSSEVKEVSVQELKALLDGRNDVQLIDVREAYEREIASLGGELIPLAGITQAAEQIAKDKQVIVYCRTGRRSATAIEELQQLYQFDNLFNLKGGITAYSLEIDSSLPTY